MCVGVLNTRDALGIVRYYGEARVCHKSLAAPRFSQSNEKAQICEELAAYIVMMSLCGRVWFLAQEMRVKTGASRTAVVQEDRNPGVPKLWGLQRFLGPTNSLHGS